jgi:hypothetical protein
MALPELDSKDIKRIVERGWKDRTPNESDRLATPSWMKIKSLL